jgi:hypothetical protein
LITTGFLNSIFGSEAGSSMTTGDSNTLIGWDAGSTITDGYENIMIASKGIISGNNNIRIGSADLVDENNTIRIGNVENIEQILIYVGGGDELPYMAGATEVRRSPITGQLVVEPPSIAANIENVQNIGTESSNIFDLQPISYNYTIDKSKQKRYGLEKDHLSKTLNLEKNINCKNLCTDELVALMLNEQIKMKKAETENIQKINELESTVKELRNMIIALQQKK